jgi:alkanesulfonate monooxygenase SsuD/methylene tetrahydromethanopterin reductase-like flavin-dependent oxidoreductase (luciferase family)
VTLDGRHWRARDAVLVPRPARRIPLMIGSSGPRMLAATLPHADAWNTWYDLYGNTVEGFAAANEAVSVAARAAGRDPAEIRRSACAFVVLDEHRPERPIDPSAPPLRGDPAQIADALRALAGAGAHEAILVVSPCAEPSIRRLGDTLALLDRA